MIEISFMRHGRSRADDEKVLEGRYDSPLTEAGRTQAKARAEELRARGAGFDAIIASPLVRALETAEIVGKALGLEAEKDAGWTETDNGPLAGLSHRRLEGPWKPPTIRQPNHSPNP